MKKHSSILILMCLTVIGLGSVVFGQSDDVNKYIADLESPDANLRISAIEAFRAQTKPARVKTPDRRLER